MPISLLFIGFHSAGSGAAPESQGERLAVAFAEAGYRTATTSASRHPVLRLLDQISTAARRGRSADVWVVDTFSGRSFVTAEVMTRLGRLLRVPVVLVLHGGGLPAYADDHPQRVDRALQRAARVITPSEYLAAEFRARGHHPQVVPNLVELDKIEGRYRERISPHVLWMRSFEPTYQPDLAIEAFARFRKECPRATMTMAGADQGGLSPAMAMAERLGVSDAVRFPGYLHWEEKAAALLDHDVFLNTTRIDNTPVSLLEAAAAGMVIVTTPAGGIPWLFDDGTTALFARAIDDPEGLASQLERAVAEPDLGAELSRAAQELAERFSWSVVRRRWEQVFTLLGAAPGDPGDGVGPLRLADLDEIADIHALAFPQSALVRLGSEAVRRYYEWQLIGPHDAVALGLRRNGDLQGFVFAGNYRGAMAGFVRTNLAFLATRVARHPGYLRSGRMRGRASVGMHSLLRRAPGTPATTPDPGIEAEAAAPSPGPRFGILAIGVRPEVQGSGIAQELMAAAEAEARRRTVSRMHLTVEPTNTRAVRFYERLGWRRVVDPDGAWTGAMERRLESEG